MTSGMNRPAPSRARTLFLWIFSAAMVLTAGTAFIFKLVDFYITATTQGSAALGSFLIPVMTYLLVAAGFGCLAFWAYCRGEFRDVEQVKYRMLEMQEQFEREERA